MELLSLVDAAKLLCITPRYLQKLCRARQIKFIRCNRTSWIFTREALDDFLNRQTIDVARSVKKLDRKPFIPVPYTPGIENIGDRLALRKELRAVCQ
jgi:excisionase family DNA binding protein